MENTNDTSRTDKQQIPESSFSHTSQTPVSEENFDGDTRTERPRRRFDGGQPGRPAGAYYRDRQDRPYHSRYDQNGTDERRPYYRRRDDQDDAPEGRRPYYRRDDRGRGEHRPAWVNRAEDVQGERRAYHRDENSEDAGRRPYYRRRDDQDDAPEDRRPYYRRDDRGEWERRPYHRDENFEGAEGRPYYRRRDDQDDAPEGRRPYYRRRDDQGDVPEGRRPYYRRDNQTGEQRRPYVRRDPQEGVDGTARPLSTEVKHLSEPQISDNQTPDTGNSYTPEDFQIREQAPVDGNVAETPRPRRRRIVRTTSAAGNGAALWQPRPQDSGNRYDRQDNGQKFRPRGPRQGQAPKPRKRIEAPVYPEEVAIDPIRLNRYIANTGLCSRREADEYIQAGRIMVNGAVVSELGVKVNPTDVVSFDGKDLMPERKIYLLLNKPKGFVTSLEDEKDRKTVMELVEHACSERIYPVGRLDRQTTGVLLFTNDGELALKLTHPANHMRKIYQVQLDRPIPEEDLKRLADGIELEDGFIAPDAVAYANESDASQVGVEIHSGRNRIVRRMFECIGYSVKKLDRVYFAGLSKKGLKRGKWRFLSPQEVAYLKMMPSS